MYWTDRLEMVVAKNEREFAAVWDQTLGAWICYCVGDRIHLCNQDLDPLLIPDLNFILFCNFVLYLYASVLDCASSVSSIVLGFMVSRVVFCLYLVRFYVPNGLLYSFYLILIHLKYRRVICIPFHYKKNEEKKSDTFL